MPESPTDLPRGYQYPENTARADPSALTVAMLERAVAQLREFYDAQLQSLKDGLETAHQDYVRVPTLLDRAIAETKELFDVKIHDVQEVVEVKIQAAAAVREEQFRALDVQLKGRAKRAKDLDTARENALNHALSAAKELVAASNSNFTIQIDRMQQSFGNQIAALEARVNDQKEELIRFSSATQGASDHRKDYRDNTSLIIAGLAVVVALGLHFLK